MNYENVVIEKIASIDPPEYLTSSEIEKLLDETYKRLKLPPGRLELITGIKRRGFWPREMSPSTIANLAVEKIFKDQKSLINEVDLLINCSVCRDQMEPSTASEVHRLSGLKNHVINFDLSNACLGMLSGLQVAAEMIERKTIKKALLVSGENSGSLLKDTIQKLLNDKTLTRKSIKPFIASLTIGSAAVAVVVSHKNFASKGLALERIENLSNTSVSHLCRGGQTSEGILMRTDSEELLNAGIELGSQNWKKFVYQYEDQGDHFDKVISHQVGKFHRDNIYKNLKINIEKDYSIFEYYGNSGSAAIFSALDKAIEDQFIKSSDNVALLGIGSGLHCSMAGLKCL
ncbi:MAG: 3-oxoacyl-ACP synthase III [Halobacteriovoraceae bacterium]|nr:3-oxoacyl-ACP synthase III [Halobacteriovoraceae bacterium]MCB9093548.1 3-oxoacyl-ACP synthase III [Halobacteriovoraceae bacterium]